MKVGRIESGSLESVTITPNMKADSFCAHLLSLMPTLIPGQLWKSKTELEYFSCQFL